MNSMREPSRCCMSSSSASTCACTETSSAETASSAISTSGSHGQRARDADALALAAREFVRIAVERLGLEPHQPHQLLGARPSAASRGTPKFIGPSMIDAPTVRRGSSERYGSWNTICTRRRNGAQRAAAGFATDDAADADRRRASARSAARCSAPTVDLPEPDSPTMPSVSPGGPRGRRRRPRAPRGAGPATSLPT